jgi:hypothetical protein
MPFVSHKIHEFLGRKNSDPKGLSGRADSVTLWFHMHLGQI